ncbi:MAG TPA: hypothetical protein VGC42_22555, partial [Kofleriaceae bacterium]
MFARDRAFAEFQDSYDYATRTSHHYLSPVTPDGRLDVTSLGPGGMAPAGCTSSLRQPTSAGGWTNADPANRYNEASANYLYTPSARWTVFATGGNRINDQVSLFVEGLYLHRDSARTFDSVPFDGQVPISKDSLYNPTGADILDYRRRLTDLAPRSYADEINTTRLVLGLCGELPDAWGAVAGWPFEVSFNWGNVTSLTHSDGQFDTFHARTGLGPSMLDASGQPICVRVPGDASTQIFYMIFVMDAPKLIPCTPLDILAAPGKIPKAQVAKFRLDENAGGTDEQQTLLATTGGKLVDLPDRGEIALTAGAQYRYELGTVDPTGGASTGYTSALQAFRTNFRFHVYEGFAELA